MITRAQTIIATLSRINPISRIETHFFNIHSNIVFRREGFPTVILLKILLCSPILAECPAHLKPPALIPLTLSELLLCFQKPVPYNCIMDRVVKSSKFNLCMT